MNKTAILPAILVAALGVVGAVQAQTSSGGTSTAPVVSGSSAATNNAVNTAPANNAGAPIAGANSFTEGQARERMQGMGFTQVGALALDSKGVWRGKAMKNGQSVDVSMDYQGNIVPQ